jgi:hypothetical protein
MREAGHVLLLLLVRCLFLYRNSIRPGFHCRGLACSVAFDTEVMCVVSGMFFLEEA